MNKSKISSIQLVVIIVAVIYIIAPDLFIGPVDDAAVGVIAAIAEVVLGVVRSVAPPAQVIGKTDIVE